jgi:hypothetical protein
MILSENVVYNSNQHDKIINSFSSDDIILREIYKHKTLLFKQGVINNFTISLDASASMLQILGLLINNYSILRLTNVIGVISDSKDIYTDLLSKLSLPNINRSFIKVCVMKYIYGSNINTITRELSKLSKAEQ